MASQKKSQIPVTVLTGFLGSGKTTLLNHILQSKDHGMRFAVIENEFGDVGVDEKVLQKYVDEEVIEVMNGCICCTVRGDLVKALKNLYKRVESFDGILIETTGLADPAPVVQTFFVDEDLSKLYKLDAVITVVDAKHVLQWLDRTPASEDAENECLEQIAFADKVLLNKIDLVEESVLKTIEGRIAKINGEAPVLRTTHAKVNPKELINVDAFSLKRALEWDPELLVGLHDHEHDETIGSISFKFEGELNNMLLQNWIQRLLTGDIKLGDDDDDATGAKDQNGNDNAMQLYRYKGLFAVKGFDEKFVFQGVGMIFSGGFMDEVTWQPGEVRESRMVFIGRNLDTGLLEKGFEACKVKQPLRFKEGQLIEASCAGGYKRGTIMRLWDEGNAYRIKLKNRFQTEIWAPLDIDAYVRLPLGA